jgi:putative transposase
LVPRRARIVAAEYPIHAIPRGVDRTAIFFAHEDNPYLLDNHVGFAATDSVAVHAYVLMTNHVHLLMTPETEAGVSKMMKGVGQCYVQCINRSSGKSPLCSADEHGVARREGRGRGNRTKCSWSCLSERIRECGQ